MKYIYVSAIVALLIGIAAVQPLYALQKVQEIRLQRQEFVASSGFAFPLCGQTDFYTLDITLRNYHFILYSDDSYKVTAVTNVVYYDSEGKQVANSSQTQLYGDATNHNQFNVVTVCSQGGHDVNFHFGYTIENGIIKEIHLVN